MKRLLFVAALLVSAFSSSGGQSLGQLPRATVATGMNDSTLIYVSDSAKRSRAAVAPDFRKMLSLRAFDSLMTTNLRLTGGAITGSPTATFGAITVSSCTGCAPTVVDSATGAARAQILTTARTIGGTSFNGSANIVPGLSDSSTGSTRAQKLTTARTINGTSFDGTGNVTVTAAAGTLTGATLASGITASSLTSFGVGALADSSTGSARAQKLTTARNFWGVSFDGTANVTTAPTFGAGATVSNGQTLALGTSTITGTPTWSSAQTFASGQKVDSATGAARSQTLTTARTINGTSFDGSANITVTAAAGTLTGTTLNSTVTASSLTSFGVGSRTDSATGAARSQTLTTARTLWGQSFNGSAAITGSLTSVGSITGGASSMTITAGTGNSRTMGFVTTDGTGANSTALTIGADAVSRFGKQLQVGNGSAGLPQLSTQGDSSTGVVLAGDATVGVSINGVSALKVSGGAAATLTGGAGNLTILAGTGNNRTMTLQTSNGSTAKNTLVLGADTSVTALGNFRAGGLITATSNNGAAGPSYRFFDSQTSGMLYNGNNVGADTVFFATTGVRNLGITGGATAKLLGGAGNMTVLAGTGASRQLAFQTTTSGSTATTALRLNELQQSIGVNGTQNNPGFSFGGDTTMGLRRVGTGVMGVSMSGQDAVTFSLTALDNPGGAMNVTMGAGSPTTPTYSFNGDANVGMYRYSSDSIGFASNGVLRVIIADQGATGAGDVSVCIKTTGVAKVLTQGAACGTSSAKAKVGFGSIFNPVEKTMALRPSSYSYIPGMYDGRHEYGLVADSTMAVDSLLVFRAQTDQFLPNGQTIRKGDALNVNDRAVLALLTATVQELVKKGDRQQATIDSLRVELSRTRKP